MKRGAWIFVFLVMAAAAGCTAPAASTAPGRDASAFVKITNTHFTRDSGGEVIATGTVANHAHEPVHNVVLTARVYGNSGQVLGEGVVALEEPLPPRRSRSFNIPMHNVRRGQRAALTVFVTRAEIMPAE